SCGIDGLALVLGSGAKCKDRARLALPFASCARDYCPHWPHIDHRVGGNVIVLALGNSFTDPKSADGLKGRGEFYMGGTRFLSRRTNRSARFAMVLFSDMAGYLVPQFCSIVYSPADTSYSTVM